MQTIVYIIVSVLVVSAVSLIGIFSFLLRESFLKKSILYLVSFSAGALMGDAFIHLLPEAIQKSPGITLSAGILSGIILFFIVEKIVQWRHCHDLECEQHPKTLGYMNLIGDAVHNFLDGVLIAGSYLASTPLGLTTTMAVLFHEIPQEIGDFGVLLHSGFSKKRALILNLLSALFALIGAIATILLGGIIQGLSNFTIPLAAGGFIYIAGSDLIPEMHKETKTSSSILQLIAFIAGIIVMYALLALE